MVVMLYTFEVPAEKHSEYLKATAEIIKPFWESHGCNSYTVWQAADGGTSFIKPMVWDDVASMEKSQALRDSEGKPVIALFNSFAINVTRKVYIQKA
jgi:quinol monooxygenase YgiN